MSDVLSRELPAPKRWQELESICFDVFSRLWKTTDAELHGRTGQPQAGVDVYGTNRVEGLFTGVQCKGKDADYGGALTERELRDEVAKALTFQPPLEAYVVVTTAPNDVAVQKVAREISAEHKRTGLFEVRVMGWDTLRHHIANHQDLLLKYFRDFAPVDVLSQLASSARDQAQGFAGLAKMIQTNNRLIADVRDDKVGADELAVRATEVSKLIGDGSPRAALKALDRMLAEEGATASPLAKYRMLASKGNAYYALGDESEAIASFKEAHEAYPEYANARATLAIAHLLEGDQQKALQLATSALGDDPDSARTASVVIDAQPDGASLDDIISLLSPELLADPDIKLHLALRAHFLGDEVAHLRLSEEALTLAPNDWRTLSSVAEALMQPLASLDGIALTRSLPEGWRPNVERAVELLGQAWAVLAERDSSFQGRHVAANLISLLGLLGRDGEAEAVLDQALITNPNYDPLAYRSAQRAASEGDWQTTAAILDSIPEAEISFDSLLLRTQAALELEDVAAAAGSLKRLKVRGDEQPPMAERDQLIAALDVKVAVLNGADRTAAVEEAIRADPNAIVLRSVLFDGLPEDSSIRALLVDEIRELAKGEITLRERVHAAETLYVAGSYSLAADLYAPLHDRTDGHALRRRLQALHLADRRAEARKLFESLPSELRSSPGYITIGINIYERVGLLRPALALLEKAIANEDALRLRLAWMQILVRLGRHNQFVPWLRQVPEDVPGAASELMGLARIIDQYIGRDVKALAIGYRALRAGYGKPEIHLGYALGLVINGRPDDAAMQSPPVVAVGTGVAILNEATGETVFRIIEDSSDPFIERGELAANDPFAQRLIGLSVGDKIDVAKAGVGMQAHRIVEIQSRYLFAFRRTLRDFASLFPQNPAFGSFEIDDSKGDEKFEDMFALARRRAGFAKEIEAIYRDNVIPLPMMAKFAGSDIFDLWERFSRDPALGLKSALGVGGEFEAGRAAGGQGISVVDPASIYAWTKLGIADQILKSPYQLAVVQATIDMFRQLVEEREANRGRKMGTFGWDGEHYRFVELTEDAINQQVSDASAALTLAESLMLVPAETDHTFPEQIADLLADLDPAYHDTLLAGLQPKRSVLTDDLGFRVIVQEAGAPVTWTQAFAQASHGVTGLSHPEYRAVIGSLIDANYRFTQFGHADILGELHDSNWTITDRLRDYARLMMSETLDRSSIAILLSQLLIDSRTQAPDDQAFAAFLTEYRRQSIEAGQGEQVKQDYDAAMQQMFERITRSANRVILPPRLLGTTHLTPPEKLAERSRQLADRQVNRVAKALRDGGFVSD
jgi:tetratricopeptide (TPR) repeat protein